MLRGRVDDTNWRKEDISTGNDNTIFRTLFTNETTLSTMVHHRHSNIHPVSLVLDQVLFDKKFV